MKQIDIKDDYVFVMEDVARSVSNKEKAETTITDPKKVTARMIIRKSTLLKWIDLIESGYIDNVTE